MCKQRCVFSLKTSKTERTRVRPGTERRRPNLLSRRGREIVDPVVPPPITEGGAQGRKTGKQARWLLGACSPCDIIREMTGLV